MINDDNTVYTMKQLMEEGRNGCFPLKSRGSILRLAAKGELPAHQLKIRDTNSYWYFIGSELIAWMKKN